MTKPIASDPMDRKRVFDADIIELCVRCYITQPCVPRKVTLTSSSRITGSVIDNSRSAAGVVAAIGRERTNG